MASGANHSSDVPDHENGCDNLWRGYSGFQKPLAEGRYVHSVFGLETTLASDTRGVFAVGDIERPSHLPQNWLAAHVQGQRRVGKADLVQRTWGVQPIRG